MSVIYPIRALRPGPARAPLVAAPPSWELDLARARAAGTESDLSILHVTRPEIGGGEPLAHAWRRLVRLIEQKVLVRDPEPRYYVYVQRDGWAVKGLVACLDVAAYVDGTVRRTEQTREAEVERAERIIDSLGAHTELATLAFAPDAGTPASGETLWRLSQLLDEVTAGEPLKRLAHDQLPLAHAGEIEIWAVPAANEAAVEAALKRVGPLYLTGGHHLADAAARVHESRVQRGKGGEHDRFPVLIQAGDLAQPHPSPVRLVRDRRGRPRGELLRALGERLEIFPAMQAPRSSPRRFGIFDGERWHAAHWRAGPDRGDLIGGSAHGVAQREVLEQLLSIDDARRSVDVDYLPASARGDDLGRRMREGRWSLAIAVPDLTLGAVKRAADAGRLFPPRSVSFSPQPWSGLLLHPF
jgi:uncharacterized protein (DUF1015 family)